MTLCILRMVLGLAFVAGPLHAEGPTSAAGPLPSISTSGVSVAEHVSLPAQGLETGRAVVLLTGVAALVVTFGQAFSRRGGSAG